MKISNQRAFVKSVRRCHVLISHIRNLKLPPRLLKELAVIDKYKEHLPNIMVHFDVIFERDDFLTSSINCRIL
jgi:hypothetical protein